MMNAKRIRVFWLAGAIAAGAVPGAWGVPPAPATAEVRPGGETVRALPDPGTASCWLLKRDESNSGGPGRWVLAGKTGSGCGAAAGAGKRVARSSGRPGAPVIKAGERMVVEEKTPLLDARLEAVALEPGGPGAEIGVRLAIGGKRMRAVVLGPGRARLLPGKGLWR